MSTSATVPVFDPQGVLRDVPQDRLKAAVDAGGKPSVRFQAPDGKIRYVPADRTADAVKAGGQILPIEQQDIKQPGFWAGLGNDALAMGKSILNAGPETGTGDQIHQNAEYLQKLKNEGHSLPYRLLMSLTPDGMRESAESGDVAGVVGHTVVPAAAALSPLATTAATEAASQMGSSASARVSPATRAAAGAAPDAVAAAVKKLPVSVIRNVPWIGDVLHDMYQAGAEAYRKGQPALDKGAPLPAAPPQEMLQANSLLRGPQPIVDPAQGLGSIPVKPGAAGSVAQSVAAPAPKITPKVMEQQLGKALGAQELKPNVPLRDQLSAKAPEAPKLPEGFTPVDSSALKGFKYDPATKEFETITQGGQRYIHGDVSPEAVQSFMDAESKGKAWQGIRNDGTLVAKVVNGKRVAVKPTSAASAGPESSDLASQLQQSVENVKAQKASGAPRFVYRARDVGEAGVPLNNDAAQATSDPLQAMKYAEAGQRGAQAGEVVKIDLSKLKPSDYVVKTHPGGAKWIQFTRPLTEDEISVFAGKTAGKK